MDKVNSTFSLKEIIPHFQEGVTSGNECAEPYRSHFSDSFIPQVVSPYCKWHKESSELYVLFNSAPMKQNNPLLVLGPYGVLCWEGIVQGQEIRFIRQKALSVFGVDEVIPFLIRLEKLGFISCFHGDFFETITQERMVKEFAAPEVQFRLPYTQIPWYCLWELTSQCDLRCSNCYQGTFSHPGPDSNQALTIASQFIDAGIFYVGIMGGEPLLRHDLEDIISHLRHGGVFVKIISNGQTLSAKRAEQLFRAGINQVEISFDGLTEQAHESSRGAGTFKKSVNALKNIHDSHIPRSGIVWTVHRENISEIDMLPEFMESLNVTECYISQFKRTGKKGSHSVYSVITDEDIIYLQSKLSDFKTSYPDLTITLNTQCSCGRSSVVIGHDNELRVCPFSKSGFDNIDKLTLLESWKNYTNSISSHGQLGYCLNSQ